MTVKIILVTDSSIMRTHFENSRGYLLRSFEDVLSRTASDGDDVELEIPLPPTPTFKEIADLLQLLKDRGVTLASLQYVAEQKVWWNR